MFLAAAARARHASLRPSVSPGPRRAPSSRLTGIRQLFVAEAGVPGCGCSGAIPAALWERAGVGGTALTAPWLRCPGSAVREKRVLGSSPPPNLGSPRLSDRPQRPRLTLTSRAPHEACSDTRWWAADAAAPRAHAASRSRTHGRARADHARRPGAPCSLARRRGPRARASAALRGPQPCALSWARPVAPRHHLAFRGR